MADDSSCLTEASPSAPTDTSTTQSFSNDAGCNGTVNAAFEDTEGLKNSDGAESKKAEENNHSTNGDLKSPTKDGMPPAEAVNLELVTMSPYTNSIPVKKEATELDMTDPYDEYFVPVNQHKKYIRGEKLYVTQDKRENLAGSKKKCCCGVISVLIVGAAIAILVAVLLTQENGGLTEAEGRNYDKAGFGSNLLPTSRPNSPTSQTSSTTDMSQIHLRNVLEGELTIDNMGFTPGLSNSSSSEFKTLAISLEEEIKKALFEHQELHYGSSDITVKVIEFRPGSVIVTYRVGWRFKDGIHNPSDPIDMEKLKFNLQKHLKNNDGCLYNYRIPVSSVKANRVIDGCQIDNDGCSNGCVYNTTTLRILCTCPLGFVLAEDEKNCKEVGIMETNSFDYPHHEVPPLGAVPTPEEPHNDHSWHHEGHGYDSTEPHIHYPTEEDDGVSHKSPNEHSPEHDHHSDHEHGFNHEDHMDHELHVDQEHDFDQEHHTDWDHDFNHEHHIGHEQEPPFNNNEHFNHEQHFNHEHHMEHEMPVVYPTEPTEQSTVSSNPIEPHREMVTPEQNHFGVIDKEYPMEHPSETSTKTNEPSSEHPIESSHEHTVETSHVHPVESSHEEHSTEVHLTPGILPVVSSKESQDDSPSASEDPEKTNEFNLGYLPMPTDLPMPGEHNSEDKISPSQDTNNTEMHKTIEENTSGGDAVGLLPPLTVTNTTSNDKMSPEYLPEYSTYPDSVNESQITDNTIKANATESTPIDLHIIKDMDDKPSYVGKDVEQGDQTNSTETKQIESSNTEPPNKQEEEFPMVNTERKEGEQLLVPSVSNDNNKENDTREELIDHMPEMGKMESGSSTQAPSAMVTESKEPESSPKYPEVVNDIHSIEGNPFETERLNELSMSNESIAEGKDHLYSDLHPTEKPIEHNVIETFREAKASDFINSTNETSNESANNLTILSESEGTRTIPVILEHSSEDVGASNSSIHSDSVIFVTPPTIEIKNVSDHMESQTTIPTTSLPEMPHEIVPSKIDHEIKEIVEKETTEKVLEVSSTDAPSEHMIKDDNLDDVKLDNTTESKDLSSTMTNNSHEAEGSSNMSEESTIVNTEKPANDVVPVIFVTQPPVVSTLMPETENKGSEDEMPMISVPKMPELMGPYPVEENPELQKDHNEDKTSPAPKERTDVYKLLDDESNNLNSLEDDYDNDSLKSKYQKQGKSKLLKSFNIKEIYPHHNNSEKTLDKTYLETENVKDSSIPNTMKSKDSTNQLLSDEGYTTLMPLFTSTAEASSTPSSTTAKVVETTKEIKSDQGLLSSEAYTTMSPLFRSDSSSYGTTQMKVEEITTMTPLIFDLIGGKKVDPNNNEFDSSQNTEQTKDTTDMAKEINTLPPDHNDLQNQTTPPSIEADAISNEETITKIPESLKTGIEEEKPAEDLESSNGAPTTVFPEELKEKPDNMLEIKSVDNPPAITTNQPLVSSETTTAAQMVETTLLPEISSTVDAKSLESSTTEATHAEIKDSVVQLLMNSTGLNSTLYSKCASGQWACLDGSGCIAPNSRCDSDKDCLDGSDEAKCQEQGCPGNFQCASGECLKRNLVCDSTAHCKDGSDEVNCESWKCNFDEMQCLPSSRKCIPSLWKCDNIAHCPNNEDEFGCKDSCLNDEFFCPEGWCIPLAKKCDGKTDCAKGEDEINCPV